MPARVIKYCCLLLLASISFILSAADHTTPANDIVKISFNDHQLARQIAISYHHAILEIDYQQGHIIADLSVTEQRDLRARGLTIEQATQWARQFQNFTKQLSSGFTQSNAKVALSGIEGFECYPTVEETYQQAADLALVYSELVNWIDIGDSWLKANGQGGYDLMVMQITNKTITGDKPKLFIHSSMHAREYTPAALTLDFAKQLLESYQTNADSRWIIDYHEVHILFHMNPDGRKIAESQVYQRKNMNSNHCANSTVGVDLNRNFAFTWAQTPNGSSGDACDETFRGASPESEPETQAVSDYIRSLFPDRRGPNDADAAPSDTSGVHLDIHSYSQLVLWPYGHTNSLSPNHAAFEELGNKLAWFNDYTPMQGIGLYATDGTSDAVSYGELGVAALTFELGSRFFEYCSSYEATVKPDNLKALTYAAKVVRAPYLIPSGPDINLIELNGTQGNVAVAQGNQVSIKVLASALQTKLSSNGRQVAKIEYAIDRPFWDAQAVVIELVNNDGAVDSGLEEMSGQIDTSAMAIGEHIVFVRAYNAAGQAGPVSAVFMSIGNNNSPIPEFASNCDELDCTFDASNSTDSDGTIEAYEWDFNDGNNATGVTVSHTFDSEGDKTIRLTIIDNSGNRAEKTAQVKLQVDPVVLPPPPPEESSSSGGGTVAWLLLLFIPAASRRWRVTN